MGADVSRSLGSTHAGCQGPAARFAAAAREARGRGQESSTRGDSVRTAARTTQKIPSGRRPERPGGPSCSRPRPFPAAPRAVWNHFRYSSLVQSEPIRAGRRRTPPTATGWDDSDEELRGRTACVRLPRPRRSESSFRSDPHVRSCSATGNDRERRNGVTGGPESALDHHASLDG